MLIVRHRPKSTLFPYQPLFRSDGAPPATPTRASERAETFTFLHTSDAQASCASNATGSSGGSAGPPLHQRGRTLGQPTLSRWRIDPPAVGTNLTIEGDRKRT